MAGFGLIGSIIVGAIAGWIAEKLMRANHGLLKNIIIGIIGALIGNGILRLVTGGTLYGLWGQLIVAVSGACLLIWLVRAIR